MKNKAILKKKCIEISLYTPYIFHLGQEVNVLQTYFYFYFLKLTTKYFIFLDQKSSI